jgi:hypothetical protein
VTSRLGLVALGILVALGLAEGVLRVAAALDSRVRLVATGRATRPEVRYATLEAFIASQAAHITPHKRWFNYWSNAFGFHDEEFVEPKPTGRLRILAIGDSFTFAPVPYPLGVMTLAEDGVRAACGGRDVDLLNMGLMGAGPPEYRALIELGTPRYAPDLVLVNFFVGNDGPDLHRYVHDRSPLERGLRRSYLWTFGKNLVRVQGGLRELGLAGRVTEAPPGAPVSPGGSRAEGIRELAADDPALVGPILTEPAYQIVLASDLGRLYRPRDERALRAVWQSHLADLDAAHRAVTRAEARFALVIFPSILQVDSGLRDATVARVATWSRYRGLSHAEIDADLPNAFLREFAQARAIPLVDLTPAFVAARAAAPERLYKQNDNHWTPRGNRVAAEALTAFLTPLVCPR